MERVFATAPVEVDAHTRYLSPISEVEGHNAVIRLNKEVNIQGSCGIRKHCKTLFLHVDGPVAFKGRIGGIGKGIDSVICSLKRYNTSF